MKPFKIKVLLTCFYAIPVNKFGLNDKLKHDKSFSIYSAIAINTFRCDLKQTVHGIKNKKCGTYFVLAHHTHHKHLVTSKDSS